MIRHGVTVPMIFLLKNGGHRTTVRSVKLSYRNLKTLSNLVPVCVVNVINAKALHGSALYHRDIK